MQDSVLQPQATKLGIQSRNETFSNQFILRDRFRQTIESRPHAHITNVMLVCLSLSFAAEARFFISSTTFLRLCKMRTLSCTYFPTYDSSDKERSIDAKFSLRLSVRWETATEH